MRTVTAFALLALLACTAVCQDQTETPRESFEAFIAAVLDQEMDADARNLVFERYFDFDSWLKGKSAEAGNVYTEEEVDEFRSQWFTLFESSQFSDTYRQRNVRVLEAPSADRAKGMAELVIAMDAQDGSTEKFRVLMTLSADGTHWRWYSIPRIEDSAESLTPSERIKRIEDALKLVADQRAELDAQERALKKELRQLRSEMAETNAGTTPFATPKSVVESAWTAVEKGDVDALLDCHTTRRVSESKLDAVKAKLTKTRERLMSWSVLDSTIDSANPGLATVRVELKLQRTGDIDERTVSIRVVRDDKDWKIDEAP
ncbi:MAG: hypothetical protein KDB32_05230 [Planctomycetes bacterium]|nr:hypothetical protein [Planctomycetota bacterium]